LLSYPLLGTTASVLFLRHITGARQASSRKLRLHVGGQIQIAANLAPGGGNGVNELSEFGYSRINSSLVASLNCRRKVDITSKMLIGPEKISLPATGVCSVVLLVTCSDMSELFPS
jgi:hypothetical protein